MLSRYTADVLVDPNLGFFSACATNESSGDPDCVPAATHEAKKPPRSPRLSNMQCSSPVTSPVSVRKQLV